VTVWGWLACAGTVLVLSSVLGFALLALLGPRIYANGVRAGQEQAARSGEWHPAISDGWNPAGIPRKRDRAPDCQASARDLPPTIRRPGFYTQL
jgi:hypothetical protein